MAQVRIDFQGRRKVETFSWARIQAMRDGVQLALRIGRQVRTLGQVLTQQPIRVLVGATLPGAVRIGKEDLDREALGQALVLGHLFPAIIGQRFAQQRGHVPEFLGESLSGTRRIRRRWRTGNPRPGSCTIRIAAVSMPPRATSVCSASTASPPA